MPSIDSSLWAGDPVQLAGQRALSHVAEDRRRERESPEEADHQTGRHGAIEHKGSRAIRSSSACLALAMYSRQAAPVVTLE